jgi:hypothetical protein
MGIEQLHHEITLIIEWLNVSSYETSSGYIFSMIMSGDALRCPVFSRRGWRETRASLFFVSEMGEISVLH